MMDEHRAAFLEEAYELLTELQDALLTLEQSPDDSEQIDRIFRAIHTLKGSGQMFGFDDLAAFTHEVETVLDQLRAGHIQVTRKLIDLILASCDHIKLLLDRAQEADSTPLTPQEDFDSKAIIECLGSLSAESGRVQTTPPNPPESETVNGRERAFRIRFRPSKQLFLTGTNPLRLLDELRELGECIVMGQTDDIPSLHDMNPESCYVYWDVLLTTPHPIDAVRGVFIFVEEDSELHIQPLDETDSADLDQVHKKLGEILVERGDVSSAELEHALGLQRRIGDILVDTRKISRGLVDSALAEQRQLESLSKKRQAHEVVSSVRVPAERLDRLMDLTGELVTTQARLSRIAGSVDHPELSGVAEEVERLIAELRDNTMSIRMVPIGTTFRQLKRLVRDLSGELGKDVTLVMEGGETELDKTVIERLHDPLVHILRNAIDHGIESPKARENVSKPCQGTVHLRATHEGAYVLVEVSDDGAGLDPEVIRSKAIEKGLIAPAAELSEKEIFELIMLPGFSTAQAVTSVSGRGVGMDVVRRGVEALRGDIEIESERGSGTTISVRLPLTLAIIDGLLVKVAEDLYVMPLSLVRECVELNSRNGSGHGRQNLIEVRGELVPFLPLRTLFEVDGEPPELQHVAIAEIGSQLFGLVVDEVVGEHQTVIKALGRVYRGAREFSGATILADGTIALILDLQKIMESAEEGESDETGMQSCTARQ
ncbi:MAG: chemotaxis protein CheA [Acidobacteriota bacterium]